MKNIIMNFNELCPNILSLQEDAIDLLEQTDSLIDRASKELGYVADKETDTKELTVYRKNEISANITNLKNLELRMTVVATAKSGKSTFINAISGQDILPSRQTPMTALPTEIVFSNDARVPILRLDQDILSILSQIISSIKDTLKVNQQLNELEVNELEVNELEVNELEGVIEKIQSDKLIFHESVNGVEEINRVLTDLNDTIRLSKKLNLNIAYNIFETITKIPRIEASFCQKIRIQESENIEDKDYKSWKGKLVIVDTPGPNDSIAENNSDLWLSVCTEMGKSLIILFIIDSSQLHTNASEKFRKDVQKIIRLSESKDFYVLVNKMDQNIRDRDKLTPEQLLQKVAIQFGVKKEEITNRVFTISGIWAFTALFFLGDVHDLSNDEIVDNRIASEKLAIEIRPIGWKNYLLGKTKEELQLKAEELLRESGFEEFINRVLQILIEESAPRIISSALRRTNCSLNNLSSQIKLQDSIRSLSKKSEEIQDEVERFNSYLWQLQQTRNNDSKLQKGIDKLKNNFQAEINRVIQEMQNKLIQELRKKWENLEHDIAIIQDRQGNENFSEIKTFLSSSSVGSKFLDLLIQNININSEDTKIKGGKSIVCKNQSIADELANYLDLEIKGILKGELLNKKESLERLFDNMHISLNSLLDEVTSTIIDELRTRLEKVFNVRISFPDVSQELENFESKISPNKIQIKKSLWNQIIEFSKTILNNLKLVFTKKTEDKKDKKETESEKPVSYSLNIEEAFSQTQAIRQMCNSFKESCIKNVDEELAKHISSFYNEINDNLKTYQKSLQIAKTKKDNNTLNKQKYEYFENEVNGLINKIEKRLEFANSVIKK